MKVESSYTDVVATIVLNRLRVTALTGAVLFLLGSAMIDLPVNPAYFIPFLKLRLCVSFFLLLIAILSLVPAMKKHYSLAADACLLICAAAICWMVRASDGALSNYYQGLYIVLCAIVVVNSYSFWNNLIVGLSIIAFYFIAVFPSDIPGHLSIVLSNGFFLFSVFLMVLLITHMFSRQHYAEYLQKKKIIENEKLKSEFFANVSHEFRTPLTLILSPLEALLSAKYGAVSNEISRLLETMHHNTVRLLQMVTGILDFSKLESQMVNVKRQAVDVVALTSSIVHDFSGVCEKKKLECLFSASLPQKTAYQLDYYLYERILFNLLSNAVKFTPEGGRVEVDLSHEKDSLYLRVSDSGIGIPESEYKNLFQKFRQLESSSVRRYEGTGLGLAMVREFSRLMGGDVSVESIQGKRTTFTVCLHAPIAESVSFDLQRYETSIRPTSYFVPPAAGLQNSDKVAVEGESDETLPKVLIAEDNNELAHYIASLLRPICRIIRAVDGDEAFRLAETELPDLILSDVMMPEKDGFTLCLQLKNNPPTAHIPVVLLTALTHRDALLKGWEAGADEYLFKPFHPEELIVRIRSMLNLVKARRQYMDLRVEIDHAMAHILDASARFDMNGKCQYVNHAYARLLGYESEEIMDKSWLLSVDAADHAKVQSTYAEMVENGMAEATVNGCRKNGHLFKMRLVMVRSGQLNEKPGYYIFLKDITETQYRQALEIKNEMLATVSHELKTPLHILREGTRILMHSQLGPINTAQRDLLETSMQNLERMLRLVTVLLDYQKVETGISQFHFKYFSINELIQEAVKQIRTMADLKGITVIEELNKEIPSLVADRDRIFQVISNLLDNAVKFTLKGTVTIRSLFFTDRNIVRIEVEDTGIGIEKADFDRLFKDFGQLETGKALAPFRGAGLGLAISKKIITAHQGKIGMNSVFGKGSLFYIELPLRGMLESIG